MANTSTKKSVYSITLDPVALGDLRAALRLMDKETSAKLRDMAQPLSKRLAGQLMMFGMAAPAPQTKLVLQSMTTPRDRVIRVDLGGVKKVGRPYGGVKNAKGKPTKQEKAPAGALLWGTEYGSHEGVDRAGRKYSNRFKARYKSTGYWIAPATDFYAPVVAREYSDGFTQIVKELKLNGNA
jgi:hypothetical protein